MNTIFKFIQKFIRNYKNFIYIRKKFPDFNLGNNVLINGNLNNLKLGKSIDIQHGTYLHLGGYNWCQNTGYIEIGDGSVISPYCVIYGCGPGGVHIGKRFDCGPGVQIFASRTDYNLGVDNHIFAPVKIGDEVIIYSNCVIGPGVEIGDRAVIAAGSVVTNNVPANTLVGGSPAKIIRQLR